MQITISPKRLEFEQKMLINKMEIYTSISSMYIVPIDVRLQALSLEIATRLKLHRVGGAHQHERQRGCIASLPPSSTSCVLIWGI